MHLPALHRWIAIEADPLTADGYIDRIEKHVSLLSEFPGRGTPRDDLSPGLRTITFERRVVIAYMVDDTASTVSIMRVINSARDLRTLFSG